MTVKTFANYEPLSSSEINTYCYNNGLKYVASSPNTSFGTTINMQNCFTSEFDAYKIIINRFVSNTGSAQVRMRMSYSGNTDYSGAAYYSGYYGYLYNAGSTRSGGDSAATSWYVADLLSPRYQSGTIDITGIITPRRPIMNSMMCQIPAAGVSSGATLLQTGYLYNQLTYTGFTLFSTANFFADVTVYGYRKA